MNFKKTLLAAGLALSMTAGPVVGTLTNTMPVFAEGNTDAYTITLPSGEHKYQVYQIFTGDLAIENDKSILSNVKWGKNGTVTEGQEVSATVLQALAALADSTNDRTKMEEISKYVNLSSTPYATNQTGSVSVDKAGYYLIRDVPGSIDIDASSSISTGDEIANDAYTFYIVEVVGNVNVTRKAAVPQVKKEVEEDGSIFDNGEPRTGWGDVADYNIGDAVPFKITATLPDAANYARYNTYKIIFHDTLDAQFDAPDEDSVKVYDKDHNEITEKCDVTVNDHNITVTVFTKGVEGGLNLDAASEVVVEYSAVLNSTAKLASEKQDNIVYLEYSNNPNTGGEGSTARTPDDVVTVYTWNLVITKTDGGNKALPGAAFTITKEGDNSFGTKTISLQGSSENVFEIKGLDTGSYTIKETTTPSGYNTIKDITFDVVAKYTVTDDARTITELSVTNIKVGGVAASTSGSDAFTINASSDGLSTTVVNNKGTILPSTGGMGTTMLYIAGGALVVGSAVFFMTNKKMKKEN